VKALSFSTLKSFDTCPRKFHAEKVQRLYEQEKTEQILYGELVHKAAEEYVRDGKPLPEGLEVYQPKLNILLDIPGEKHCELKMAVKADGSPTKFEAPDAWFRGIADLLIVHKETARVVDYKTGSAKYPDKDQLQLMALLTFAWYPDVQFVHGALLFLTKDVLVKATYLREEQESLWNNWRQKAAFLEEAYGSDNWPPKPNGLCRNWCPVKHCEFNG
jgi:hypothetical protein